jgi:uncharacterized protein
MRIYFKSGVYLIVAIAFSFAIASSYNDFFRAIRSDNAGALENLFARGFDPNTVDPEGRSPLSLAFHYEAYAAAQALVKHPDFRFDQPNAAGETPLMLAALRGQVALSRELLVRGARLDRPGWTPLHYAASGSEPRMVEMLIGHGAPLDATAPNGNTPLMMAARHGSEAGAWILLTAGAHPGLRNRDGFTAADFARSVERVNLATEIERLASVRAAGPDNVSESR